MSRHGTLNGYIKDNCRCEECAAYVRAYRQRRRAELRATPLPDGDPRHGKPAGFNARGCRCDVCAEAAYQYGVAQRAQALAKGIGPDDPRHGSLVGYNTWGCRCDRCREAKKIGDRAFHMKQGRTERAWWTIDEMIYVATSDEPAEVIAENLGRTRRAVYAQRQALRRA